MELRKGQRLCILRQLPGLPHRQNQQGEGRDAVGTQQHQPQPFATAGAVPGGVPDGEQAVSQLQRILFFKAEGEHPLLRLADGVEHHPACAAQPEQHRPFEGQRRQSLAGDRTVEVIKEPPVEMENPACIQRPAAGVEDDPADAGHHKKDHRVLPQGGPEGVPVPRKQNVDEGQ